jgi:hypothetical protein
MRDSLDWQERGVDALAQPVGRPEQLRRARPV